MRRTLMLAIATASLLAAPAVRGEDVMEVPSANRELYLRHCGACHGPGGKGDGIAGSFMRTPPTDLTQLAKKSGGTFPFIHVMETIDGRNTVRAHGDPDMPVWGEVFAERGGPDSARRLETRGKLLVITDYLRSIQAK